MPSRSSKRRKPDPNLMASAIVEAITGESVAAESLIADSPTTKNPAAVALGKLGGAKGGKARAELLSPAKRKAIAKKAAAARWGAK